MTVLLSEIGVSGKFTDWCSGVAGSNPGKKWTLPVLCVLKFSSALKGQKTSKELIWVVVTSVARLRENIEHTWVD